METTGTTPDSADNDGSKEYAEEYKEETEEIGADEVTIGQLRHHTTDISYQTGQGTIRTVRARGATGSAEYNGVPEGFFGFYHEGTKYAYSPDERRLISIPSRDQTVTVATEESIVRYEDVSYPEKAVVDGASQTDVEATIYYRSPRSDAMQSVTIEANFMEGRSRAAQISGPEVGGDRRIEASIVNEREIKTTVPKRKLGRVARVEFPKGHRFSLTVEALEDDAVTEERIGNIEQKVSRVFHHDDADVDLTHEGRMER